MDERNVRKVNQKKEYDEQADIWKKDKEKFEEFENNKMYQKKAVMNIYFNNIQ